MNREEKGLGGQERKSGVQGLDSFQEKEKSFEFKNNCTSQNEMEWKRKGDSPPECQLWNYR